MISMFTSDSQHPPRSGHVVYLGEIRGLFTAAHDLTSCTNVFPEFK